MPPIVVSPDVACPVVAGLVRPTVVLPVAFVAQAETTQLADVLIHECAHALRHDTWIGLAQRLVQLAFWPHPLNHYEPLPVSFLAARCAITMSCVKKRLICPDAARIGRAL